MELGAGVGIASITLNLFTNIQNTVISDRDLDVLNNIELNLKINKIEGKILNLDWNLYE